MSQQQLRSGSFRSIASVLISSGRDLRRQSSNSGLARQWSGNQQQQRRRLEHSRSHSHSHSRVLSRSQNQMTAQLSCGLNLMQVRSNGRLRK